MVGASVRIDLKAEYQTIDGFGANINPVGHWRGGALRPVIDRLVDDLGATIFRLDPCGFSNWSDPNGALGRESLNPVELARVYESTMFQDAWDLGRYMNQRNVEFILNVSGVVPRWMCGSDGATLTDYDAYVELLTSLVLWAREREGLRFRLFGPFNETDLGPPEGPLLSPEGLAKVTALLAQRLEAVGHGDVRLVVAEQGHFNLEFLEPLSAEPSIRDSISVVAMHCYSDMPLDSVRRFLDTKGLHDWRYWLTEYGDLDQTGECEWEVAISSTRRLLRGLRDGVRAALVWDAYDNWHGHDEAWTIWGILRCAREIYTPKKRYFAAKQIYRFVPPGSVRVEAVASDDLLSLTAFRTPDGRVTLVGANEEPHPVQLALSTNGHPVNTAGGNMFVTSRSRNCELVSSFPFGPEIFLTLPGQSIFTFTTANIAS